MSGAGCARVLNLSRLEPLLRSVRGQVGFRCSWVLAADRRPEAIRGVPTALVSAIMHEVGVMRGQGSASSRLFLEVLLTAISKPVACGACQLMALQDPWLNLETLSSTSVSMKTLLVQLRAGPVGAEFFVLVGPVNEVRALLPTLEFGVHGNFRSWGVHPLSLIHI